LWKDESNDPVYPFIIGNYFDIVVIVIVVVIVIGSYGTIIIITTTNGKRRSRRFFSYHVDVINIIQTKSIRCLPRFSRS